MNSANQKILVCISSCLLGEPVRYDGGHRHAPELIEKLEATFDLMPICPEMAIGMGVPRDPIRLVSTTKGIRVLGVKDNCVDVTARLEQFGDKCALELTMVCGYVFKARSPSCGVHNVKTYDENKRELHALGTGIYAQSILAALPDLPVSDESKLKDPAAIDAFIQCVHDYHQRT